MQIRTQFPTPGRAAFRVMAALGAATIWMSPQAVAQLPLNTQMRDARVVPRGLLRLGFDVEFTTYTKRYSLGTPGLVDGTPEPLGTDLTGDSIGTNLFPALLPSELAVQSITGDGAYRMNVGAFTTNMMADIRRVPLSLTLGLTNRLTFSASVPLVRSWSRVAFTMDSTDTNVGWNQAIAEVAGDASAASIALFLMQLERAIADVQSAIAGGSYGCPTSPQCDLANAAVADATQLLTDLRVLSGINSGVPQVASFAPLNTSSAGIAINSSITTVTSALEGLGATPITAVFQLPVDPTTKDNVDQLLGSGTLGYVAAPLDSVKTASIGDMELGLRYGLIMRPSFRTVLYTTARLPTGKVDLANNYVDIGTGDQQFDVALGIETSFEPGTFLGIAAHASYTMQAALDRPCPYRREPGSPCRPLPPQPSRRTRNHAIVPSRDPSLQWPTRRTRTWRTCRSAQHPWHSRADFRYRSSSRCNAPSPRSLRLPCDGLGQLLGG